MLLLSSQGHPHTPVESAGDVSRQFKMLFAMEGAELEFTADGLRGIAEIAIERETGVRALRSILEERLLDLLYELPNRKDTRDFTVDEDVVRGRRQLARGLVAENLEEEEEAEPGDEPGGDDDVDKDTQADSARESA